MARDYAAEYRARNLRAAQSGFHDYENPYAEERRQRTAEDQSAQAEIAAARDRRAGPKGMQGPFTSVQVDPDWEEVIPTRSSYSEGPNDWHPELRMRPTHRRTIAARYNKSTKRMEVRYASNGSKTEGDANYYFNSVPAAVWNQFKRHWSPGRYLYYHIEPHYGGALSLRGRPCGIKGGFDNISLPSHDGEATK